MGNNCKMICWVIAAFVGIVALVLMTGAMWFLFVLILAVVIAAGVGILLTRFLCGGDDATMTMTGQSTGSTSAQSTGTATTPGAVTPSVPPVSTVPTTAPAAPEVEPVEPPATTPDEPSQGPSESVTPVSSTDAGQAGLNGTASEGTTTPSPASGARTEDSPTPPTKPAVAKADSTADTDGSVKAELAESAPETPAKTTSADTVAHETNSAAKAAPDDAPSDADAPVATKSVETPTAKPTPTAEPKIAEEGIADIQSEGGTNIATPADPPAAVPVVADETAAIAAGTKPEGLAAPRAGGADDLRWIKGVGPKLNAALNTAGYYHFDQIATWTADEAAWVEQNVKGAKGRVMRDTWVEQAKTLAAGGETEFSKRASDGGVY